MSVLLLDAKHAVAEARVAGADRLAEDVLSELHDSYRAVIASGYEENPVLRIQAAGRQPKRTKAQNVLLRLDEREEQALRFAHDFHVPFDNISASAICGWSSRSRRSSAAGAPATAPARFLTVRSYTSIARKHGHRPLAVLAQLLAGEPWLPAPGPT
jgi:hypothetical protein